LQSIKNNISITSIAYRQSIKNNIKHTTQATPSIHPNIKIKNKKMTNTVTKITYFSGTRARGIYTLGIWRYVSHGMWRGWIERDG